MAVDMCKCKKSWPHQSVKDTRAPFNAAEVQVDPSRHAASLGGGRGAADDRSWASSAIGRPMALASRAWVVGWKLRLLTFRVLLGVGWNMRGCRVGWLYPQPQLFLDQGPVDEETAADVSDGPAYSGSDGPRRRNSILCLKRPSFYCLIHFYKRCVSSLAPMGRSPWVRSGWVSVLSVTTFFIQG